MSKQLELDINRPSWSDTNFHSEMKDLWSVRDNSRSENVKHSSESVSQNLENRNSDNTQPVANKFSSGW